MIYLDYAATTKINEEVLALVKKDLTTKIEENDLASYKKQIQKLLNTNLEINFTSGSSESNNWAIKGIIKNTTKKTIITTKLEHSSIKETLNKLEKQGYTIIYAPLENGIVNLTKLENLINNDTALITISSVNTETGIIEPINEIGKIARSKNVPFHSDITGSVGKINIPLDNVDLASFTAHKFYGPKGIGVLLTNKNIKLEKLIYGKRNYNLGLIKGLTKALEQAQENINENYDKVNELYTYLKTNIQNMPNISINENDQKLPHIMNISVSNYKPETFLHYLELNDIYISTQSACSKSNSYSEAVYALTNDKEKAETSVRISLSPHTKKQELDELIKIVKRGKHGR